MRDASLSMTLVFCALLVAGLVVRTLLASRQIRHVARHRESVPEAFASVISLESHQRAADYTIAKTRFGMIEAAYEAAVLLGWTLFGGLDWLNSTILELIDPGLWQQLILLAAYTALGAIISLPFGWYATFRLEERFGFNKMNMSLWLGDMVKGALVGALIGGPIAALVLWLMDSAGTIWWLWAWGVWTGFSLLMLVVYPTVIAPIFNKFEPLQDDSLKERVSQLMKRCGFAAKGLFVMDGSRRSAHANAYFTGFGAAKRVVFFDTLLKQLAPAEIDAVLAHELGHYKRRHILQRTLLMFSLSLLGFALLGWLSGALWFYTGLGVRPALDSSNNALAILLFLMVVPLLTYFLSPVMAQISRRHEFEADAYAVDFTSGEALANALLKLYKDNASTLTPDPAFVKFYYSHPPASERIARLQARLVV